MTWTLIYDADCGLCKWILAGLLRRDQADVLDPIALQTDQAATQLSALSRTERMQSVHLIAPDGTRFSAGAALPPLLRLLRGGRILAALLAAAPKATELAYRWVAEHRNQLSRLIPRASKRRAAIFVAERVQGAPTAVAGQHKA